MTSHATRDSDQVDRHPRSQSVPARTRIVGTLLHFRQAGILTALIVLVIAFGIAQPDYLSVHNLLNILQQAAVTGILAVGVTFVIITAGIDLSFGSTLGLSAAALGLSLQSGYSLPVAMLIALGIGVACGILNGLLTTLLGITPLIVTLGTLSTYSGIALMLTGGKAIFTIPSGFEILITSTVAGVPLSVVVLVIVTAIASFVLNRTLFGEYCIATGGNIEVARLAGIRTGRYIGMAYAVLGALAGLGAILTVGRLGAADPQAGADLLLPVIAASVIGGASLRGGEGSVVGAVIGATLVSALQAGLTILAVSAFYQQIMIGIVIIMAVTIDRIQRGELRLRR